MSSIVPGGRLFSFEATGHRTFCDGNHVLYFEEINNQRVNAVPAFSGERLDGSGTTINLVRALWKSQRVAFHAHDHLHSDSGSARAPGS